MDEEDKRKMINEAKDAIESKQAMLAIHRVPQRTYDFFTSLAEEEFCDDYGMTLKYLCDGYLDYVNVREKLIDLEKRIMKLEENGDNKEIKKTFGGKVIDG